MNKTAILCVLRSGGDFTTCDVDVVFTMLKQHVTIPFDFYCLTNVHTQKFPTLPLINEYKGWWSKIELFRSKLVPNERILYFDLDMIVKKNINNLLEQPFDFIGLRPFNIKKMEDSNYFASAILSWVNDGTFDFIYDAFNYKTDSDLFNGDQDYMSSIMQLHECEFKYWQDLVGGIYSYKRHIRKGIVPVGEARIVCFHGKPRPKEVVL